MPKQDELKENTYLLNKYFPFNIFHNNGGGHNILYLHWHDNLEIIYMVNGHAVFYIGNQSVTAVAGDIVFVNSGQLHSGYSIDDTLVDYYAIVFDRSVLNTPLLNSYDIKYAAVQLSFPSIINTYHEHYKAFSDLIVNIINEFNRKMPGYQWAIKAYLCLMVVLLLRYYPPSRTAKGGNVQSHWDMERFEELLTYVENHYFEKITVEQAARIVNLSTYHFCKTFKRITGRTFVEYLTLCRINAAEELLRSTAMPITEIAEKVGFCNINYFDRVFKQYKHYPPSQYRKNIV